MKDNEKYFTKCVHKWVKYFGLADYEVSIHGSDRNEIRGSCNWHPIDDSAQMLSICYGKGWLKKKNLKDQEINRVAFHEVCEGMLSKLNQLCHERFIQKREIQTAVHEVVRRLENAIIGIE